jgi:hypothetical protein
VIGRTGILAAAIVLAVPAVPAVADAKPTTKVVKSSGTIKGHLAQPATPEGYAFAGFVSDSKLGEGATTSQGSFDGSTTSGSFIVYLDKGTLRATFHFTVTPQADGTLTFAGTTKYHGGTGAYKRARGSGETTATQDAEGYTTFQYTQTVRVPKR